MFTRKLTPTLKYLCYFNTSEQHKSNGSMIIKETKKLRISIAESTVLSEF